MPWTIDFHEAASDEFLALPADMQARFGHLRELIDAFGLERLPAKFVKHIEGPIWEFRLTGRDGIARVLYATRNGRRIIVLRVFEKKTAKTPRRDIDLALRRMKELP
ncbi:MAG: type II toxin-antitoxin system RelE/ParE family toxin [Hyphomicrobium sp.]